MTRNLISILDLFQGLIMIFPQVWEDILWCVVQGIFRLQYVYTSIMQMSPHG